MLLAPLLLFLVVHSQPATCDDVAGCRAAALEARAQKDYERFHDLAWLAYRKGKADDPELMLLLARAQSLSGRPGDAIVMLQRLVARGVATDVATSEDFEAVRAHPRWNAATPEATSPPPKPVVPEAPKTEASKPERPKPEPAKPEPPRAEAKSELPKPDPPKATTLSFTTLMAPTALAYDAVSRRYLIADRQGKRIAVVDAKTGQVSTLAGALARLGEINGIAIDPRQGDLWVVTSSGEGMSLTRLQLISGRELAASRITGIAAPITGVAYVRGVGVVAADEQGDLWRINPTGKADKLASLEYAPRAIAADAEGTLYVAAGGPRLARFSVTPTFRRLGVIDLRDLSAAGLPFVVVGDSVHVLVAAAGAYEVRVVKK